MARRFFYVSLGILALALAFSLSAPHVGAQGTGTFVSCSVDGGGPFYIYAVTSDGDLYQYKTGGSFSCLGNFTGGPVPVEDSSFGAIKGAYK